MVRIFRSTRDGFFPDRPSRRGLNLTRRELLISGAYGTAGLFLGAREFPTASEVPGPQRVARRRAPAAPQIIPVEPEKNLPSSEADQFAGVTFDTVIEGGRVVDPETRFDQQANVGIIDGKVAAITAESLVGRSEIPAGSMVVAPGFVDILSYEPNPFGVGAKLLDGVTTNLAMHGISNYAPDFFDAFTNTSGVHFGGAFHQHFMRGFALEARIDRPLSSAQLDRFEELARESLRDGFAGVSFSPEYSPGTSTGELDRLAAVAAEFGHVCFFHTRHSATDSLEPALNGIAEAIDVASRFDVPVHIEHITSTGGTGQMPRAIELIESARGRGLDVSACFYPYDFWGTFLASARFSDGWEQRFGLSYQDLQIAGTGQRLTAATFAQAKRENKLVAALGSIPQEDILHAFDVPWTIISSDAIARPGLNNHPRCAGTFGRTLGRYVRELGVVDLHTALAKLTNLPASRVSGMIPAMRNKGWLRVGADADIVVFDPTTVIDRASVENPADASIGFEFVLVGGVKMVERGKLVNGRSPGLPLRSG